MRPLWKSVEWRKIEVSEHGLARTLRGEGSRVGLQLELTHQFKECLDRIDRPFGNRILWRSSKLDTTCIPTFSTHRIPVQIPFSPTTFRGIHIEEVVILTHYRKRCEELSDGLSSRGAYCLL